MRTLVATFGEGDVEETLTAMRHLPYDRLVLIGEGEEPCGLAELRRLESLTGHEVIFERTVASDFMGMVDDICEVISKISHLEGPRNEVVLSISGGTKLMADAALFAAFRLGVPAYHVTDRVVHLPVMKGVTAKNRFTPLQAEFIESLASTRTLADMEQTSELHSRQSLERIMRELKKTGLVSARLESGQVTVSLTEDGHEVRRALMAAHGSKRA